MPTFLGVSNEAVSGAVWRLSAEFQSAGSQAGEGDFCRDRGGCWSWRVLLRGLYVVGVPFWGLVLLSLPEGVWAGRGSSVGVKGLSGVPSWMEWFVLMFGGKSLSGVGGGEGAGLSLVGKKKLISDQSAWSLSGGGEGAVLGCLRVGFMTCGVRGSWGEELGFEGGGRRAAGSFSRSGLGLGWRVRFSVCWGVVLLVSEAGVLVLWVSSRRGCQ